MRRSMAAGLAAIWLATFPANAHDTAHDMAHDMPRASAAVAPVAKAAITVPDIPVLDQDGRRLNFYRDLVRGRTVAIDFIFTSCSTFCPMLTANFRTVQQQLEARVGKDIALISVSIDPFTDTPARLKEFSAPFEPGPGWTFVTGSQPDIAMLLDKLGQPLGSPNDHGQLVLVHNDKVGGWTHVDGDDPKLVHDALVDAAGPAPKADAAGAARAYMQNPQLLTQDGREVRFFDDLLSGKIVLINFMLTTCNDICPMLTENLARVQTLLGDNVGRSINMISLSVDPQHDDPAKLKAFADNFGVKPGWYFLTGAPPEIDPLLRRLAGYTTDRLDHSNVVIIGNVETGVWTKVFGMAEPSVIARAALALASR
ncbi:SCO family protein [Bradyrhizobium oligotrophicum]|uniref:SCO family protein n=1 Tax=Bradyrhizobium oligotrophicum TaxID=44255 RepID=UPI003EBBB422